MEATVQDQGDEIIKYTFIVQLDLFFFYYFPKRVVTYFSYIEWTLTVWAQEDLLRLLEAMKVALPQKDLTKYKTSESHLDWQKVAFNSFTAEMCRLKWLEVSKEVKPFDPSSPG